jgi:hypothetical protein
VKDVEHDRQIHRTSGQPDVVDCAEPRPYLHQPAALRAGLQQADHFGLNIDGPDLATRHHRRCHAPRLSDRNTRKFANLAANRHVALLVDDRENKSTDTQESIAVTVLGRAFEADANEGDALARLFVARHPGLADFAATPACVVVRVEVCTYLLVQQFEYTIEWRPNA